MADQSFVQVVEKDGKFSLKLPGFDKEKHKIANDEGLNRASIMFDRCGHDDNQETKGERRLGKVMAALSFACLPPLGPMLVLGEQRAAAKARRGETDGTVSEKELRFAFSQFPKGTASITYGRKLLESASRVLERLDYSSEAQVQAAAKMLTNKHHNAASVGLAMSNMEDPSKVAKLIAAMGEKGGAVLAHVIEGRRHFAKPDVAAFISTIKDEVGNEKFNELVKSLDSKGKGQWQIRAEDKKDGPSAALQAALNNLQQAVTPPENA